MHSRLRSFVVFGALAALAAACATSGGLPDWVRNPYADFSKDKYVVAVGSGHNLDAAKRDALNGIAAFLGVEITATQGTEESETVTSEDGRRRSTGHLRAAESVNQIISQKLSSVVIERAHSQGPTTYVLATLDKATFLTSLSADADNAARQLGEGVKAAAAEGTPARTMLLGLQATAQRLEALDARIIALGGRVSPDVLVTLRDSLGFLARFDIVVPPAAPAAAAGPACDESDARLKKAIADMTALVGHAVGVTFNLDALPKGRAFCDDLFERFIGLLPKDLERLKARNAAIFAYGAPALKRIDLDYDGTTDRADIDFDRASGRLRIVMGGRGGYPIPSDAASYIFEKQYEAWVVGHFQGVEPAAVAAAEYPLYFDYLTRLAWWGRGAPRQASSDVAKDFANDPKATVVLRMIAFAPLASRRDAALGAKARDWLAERYELFGMAYLHKPGPASDAPAGSPWKRAERAWVDWMNASFEGLPDEKKRTALVEMLGFTMPFNNDEGIVWNDFAYPGLKTYEMGLGVIDRWLKAGHPAATGRRASSDDKQQQLFLAIASPVKRNSQSSWSVETIERRKNWYFHAMRTDELKKRLLGEVLARKDDVFTETVFANLLYTSIHLHGSYAKDKRDEWNDFLFFWRGVEADQRQWKVATRVLAEGELGDDTKRALYDESARLWRRYPWARGTLLYYLGVGIWYPRDLVPWKDFSRVFGAPLGAKEVADFLSVSPRAVAALPNMWPALGRGWSRADLLVPHLDRFVEDPLTHAWNFQDPYETFKDIVNNLRDEKASGDLGRLHTYFKKRVADHPSEARAYETLIDMTR